MREKPEDEPSRARVHITVTVDAALLAEAEELGVDLSQTLDEALGAELRAARREAFLRENAEAYEATRRDIEERGLPLAEYRRW